MANPVVLDEFLNFLSVSARPDLKASALQYVMGLTSSADGVRLLLSHAKMLAAVVDLTQDSNEQISSVAYKSIINICAETESNEGESAGHLISNKKLLSILLKTVVDKSSGNADNACKVLTNITRIPAGCRNVMDLLGDVDFPVDLVMLVEAFCMKNYNDKGANLDYLGLVLSNLTQLPEGREFILNKERCVVQRLLPYTQYEGSTVRRRGAVAALKNCCFETAYHDWLLSNTVDILPYLLLPLAGPEELSEEEMEGMPEDLQYLEEDKKRETDSDIKKMLLEAVMKLCSTKSGRKTVQDKRTYIIIREYHRWEKEPSLQQPIENLIQVLIKEEPEPGMGNLDEVEIPEDVARALEQSQP
ncbi:protein HGH1 homolog [Acanthaster planci]|uniref:Protein HGH1 homolog n=1 Tax=Acanthaster planci TaxID=133434 RepID=A0A8B7ZAX6_ACAPL|nr:protein HGH1 homolog [Acanthaster planci]